MAYYGLVTKIENVRKDPNSDRLYLADCFREGVIVGPNMKEGELVLYLPTDGAIERWFGDEFKLFRKNLDGTAQGGYLENNAHIRAIKLRGNESSGIVISYSAIVEHFGEQNWKDGDQVTEINNKLFCYKYIPKPSATPRTTPKTSYKGRKAARIKYPDFAMHIDTAQLAYNLGIFRPGDKINLTLKMHGTSQRSAYTWAEYPMSWFRKLFHMKPKRKLQYVLGTRRTVVTTDGAGYYGNDKFRFSHHEALKPYLNEGMEIFYEVVGWYGAKENETIMPIVDNSKINDKKFMKKFGKYTTFSYGCTPGHSAMWIYRITSHNGEYEYSPEEITIWCNEYGFNRVPIIEDFEFTTVDDLLAKIDKYFKDIVDPVGLTHVKEGVVVRIANRRTFTALKQKTWEFKVLEGLVKDTETQPDMEEAQEV